MLFKKSSGQKVRLAGLGIIDAAFSSTSTNGVQNKVIKAKFDEIESSLSRHSFGSGMNIVSGADPIDAPQDGYIAIHNTSGQNGTISINGYFAIGGVEGYFALPVKKGMRLAAGGTSALSAFWPLV